MRFPVVVAFLASIFTSVLLSHLATTTPTAHHDSFASDPAAAGDDSAAANDANATAAAGDVATSSREDFSLAENPVKDLRIFSRKKRFVCGGTCIGLIIGVAGLALSFGSAIDAETGSAETLTKLNDLDRKMHNLANVLQGIQTQLNDFESKLTLSLIKDELNYLKNTVDHLKQTTIDSNGNYGPSTLFGDNTLINVRIHDLDQALNNMNRWMTTGHPSFDQKPLVQWYFTKTISIEKAKEFKMAMIGHQVAGYEFLKILYVASCQQSNQDKPVGWCHADEAAKTTTVVTNMEKTRMETQLKGQLSSRYRFESSNYRNQYFRHRNYQIWKDAFSSGRLYLDDSTFDVVSGLAGIGISLRSKNYPQFYLRHENWWARISQFSTSTLFKLDASFIPRAGLDGSAGVSLESVNYPNHFLRHQSARVRISNNDGSALFKQDATWIAHLV